MTPDQVLSLSSLGLGLSVGGVGWYVGKLRALRRKDVDERYEWIRLKARDLGWKVTFGAMILLWVLVILEIIHSPRVVLGLLYLAHMSGWAFGAFHYQRDL